MKHLLTFFLFSTFATPSFAHPGSHKLVCKSAVNSGSKQNVEVLLKRSNGKGWINPTIEVAVDNNNFIFTTPDEMDNYGTTFHNSPLKVITVTADVPFDTGINSGDFSIVAIPSTVKAYDYEDKPVIWTLDAEKDECNDTNGRATFQGIMRGYLRTNGSQTEVEAQVMDCELTYNSGMSC